MNSCNNIVLGDITMGSLALGDITMMQLMMPLYNRWQNQGDTTQTCEDASFARTFSGPCQVGCGESDHWQLGSSKEHWLKYRLSHYILPSDYLEKLH